jgi:hypothetical protein
MPSNSISIEDMIRSGLGLIVFILTSLCTICDCIDKLQGRNTSSYYAPSKNSFDDILKKGSKRKSKKKKKKKYKTHKVYKRCII